jgi:hypothetical protein
MTLYIDCSYGASGDMLAGALIDLGADFSVIKDKLKNIPGVSEISAGKVKKSGVSATKFNVKFNSNHEEYVNLIKKIEELKLEPEVEATAKKILEKLAIAESHAHGVRIEEVHLHEAADSIVDAVSFSIAFHELKQKFNFNNVRCEKLSVGFLAPAAKYIIESGKIPIKKISDTEITTPTGAAILSAVVDGFTYEKFSAGKKFRKSGYGAGSWDFDYPNVVGIFI